MKDEAVRPLPETGFVRLPTILNVFPVGRSTWWAGVKDGRYPKAVKLSERVTCWRAEDILALIQRTQVVQPVVARLPDR